MKSAEEKGADVIIFKITKTIVKKSKVKKKKNGTKKQGSILDDTSKNAYFKMVKGKGNGVKEKLHQVVTNIKSGKGRLKKSPTKHEIQKRKSPENL